MKRVLVAIIAILIILPVMFVPASADSLGITFSTLNVTLGNKVTVNVNYSSSLSLYVASGSLSFNSSVLKYVSGGTSVSGSKVSFYKDLNGEKSTSFSVVFEAIAEGTSSMSAHMEGSDGSSKGTADSSRVLTASKPAPSSNANLSSLKIDGVSLSPAFSKNVTTYSASVANAVTKISIKAVAATSGADVSGIGEKNLSEGDNSFPITVTAPSGAKKSYTVNVRRRLQGELTEEEKLTASVGDTQKKITKNITSLPVYPNFTQSTAKYNDIDVGVLTDNNNKYTLYYLTDANGENPKLYTKNENDEFELLSYFENGGKILIVGDDTSVTEMPDGYKEKTFKINEKDYSAFGFEDSSMDDFYILNLYDGENEEYYLYDSVGGVLVRYPLFAAVQKKEEKPVIKESNADKNLFATLSKLEKILIIALFSAIIALVVLIILLSKKKRDTEEFFDNSSYGNFNIDLSKKFND